MTAGAVGQAANVGEALAWAAAALSSAGVAEPRRDSEVLLGTVLGWERARLFAHPERELTAAEWRQFESWVAARTRRVPLQYLTGRREFFEREFETSPEALIPRPETELLVERVIANAPAAGRILDAGVGSGAIAATLAERLPEATVFACDGSAAALGLARRNAERLGGRVCFFQGDWLTAVRPGSLDVVVSNPPYIAADERSQLEPEVLAEPPEALFAGQDGLDAYRRLIPQAAAVLRPGGLLLLELGLGRLEGVSALLAVGPWKQPAVEPDLAGVPRTLAVRRFE